MNAEQWEILYHAKWRAAGGMYCGSKSDPNIIGLVEAGFFREAGTPAHLPDTDAYYAVTGAGGKALRIHRDHSERATSNG